MSGNRRGVALGCLAIVLVAAFFITVPILIYQAIADRQNDMEQVESDDDSGFTEEPEEPYVYSEDEAPLKEPDLPEVSFQGNETVPPIQLDNISNEAHQALEAGNIDQASQLIDPLLENSPGNPELLYTKIKVLVRQEKYRTAIPYLDRLSQITTTQDGQLVEAIALVDYIYEYGSGNNIQRELLLEKCYTALHLRQSKAANTRLISTYLQESNYTKAFYFAILGTPGADYDAQRLRDLGNHFRKEADYEKAALAYQSLVDASDEEPASIFNSLGYSLYQLGQNESAIYYFKIAAERGSEAAQLSLDRLQ